MTRSKSVDEEGGRVFILVVVTEDDPVDPDLSDTGVACDQSANEIRNVFVGFRYDEFIAVDHSDPRAFFSWTVQAVLIRFVLTAGTRKRYHADYAGRNPRQQQVDQAGIFVVLIDVKPLDTQRVMKRDPLLDVRSLVPCNDTYAQKESFVSVCVVADVGRGTGGMHEVSYIIIHLESCTAFVQAVPHSGFAVCMPKYGMPAWRASL